MSILVGRPALTSERSGRGRCTVVQENGEPCGKPSVELQPCLCDNCDGLDEPIHEFHFCAEHWDALNTPGRCWICGEDDGHWPVNCPSSKTWL